MRQGLGAAYSGAPASHHLVFAYYWDILLQPPTLVSHGFSGRPRLQLCQILVQCLRSVMGHTRQTDAIVLFSLENIEEGARETWLVFCLKSAGQHSFNLLLIDTFATYIS